MLNNKCIGIVLASAPGYSESFIRNKIWSLKNAGYRVILFIANPTKVNFLDHFETIYGPDLKSGIFRSTITSVWVLIKAFVFNFRISSKFIRLELKSGSSIYEAIRKLVLNNFILSVKVDWLHFGFATTSLDREYVAQAQGASMAVSFRGYDHYVYPIKYKDCYKRLFSVDCKFHVLSEAMRHSLIDRGVDDFRVVKITPAIDTKLFQLTNRKLGNNNKLEITTIARLHWIKGLEYTLHALSLVKQRGIKFKYSIIGDGVEYDRLVYAAYELGIQDEVKFLGKLKQDEIKKHLEMSDLYIQYSIQEGFGNAVLEAQSIGVPCIVSDADGLKENVLNGITGWVVSKRNPQSLAQSIVKFSEISLDKIENIRLSAMRRISNEFNLEIHKDLWVKFYEVHK
jgi:glycosyltransferase involved in cell wall biosynthesis